MEHRQDLGITGLAEIVIPCLDAVRARSVALIGAGSGDITELLLESPGPELELVRETSVEALGQIEPPDAVIVDARHDPHAIGVELRLLAERVQESRLPLLLLHDLGWPPAREGENRNGVLTAIEDFVSEHDDLRVAFVPAIFGLAVLWPDDAPWAARVANVVAAFDRNPMLERLERNRVRHLATRRQMGVELRRERERAERMDELLRRLSGSRTFALAALLSRIRGRGKATLTDEELRRALG